MERIKVSIVGGSTNQSVELLVKRIMRTTLGLKENSDIIRRNKSDRKRNRANRWR